MTLIYRCVRLIFAAVLLAIGNTAAAQLPGNVEKDVRPLVHVEFSRSAPIGVRGQGVFDTGSPELYIAPATNVTLGLPASPANAMVTNFETFTAGGWYGATLDGPELAAGNHLYTSSSSTFNTLPQTAFPIAANLTDFGAVSGTFSLINVGMPFVAGEIVGVGSPMTSVTDPLVARIDPTVASPAPFALDTGGLDELRDNRMSNVSFLAATDFNVPTLTHNFNPDFLTSVTLIPESGAAFLRTTPVNMDDEPTDATTAPRPMVSLGASNPFDIPAGTYFVDSGAPSTTGPAASPALIGTDNLNKYTQYWDFTKNPSNSGSETMLLFAPTDEQDIELIGPGMLMGVDRNAVGLTHTGVNQLRTNGQPATINPGAAATPNVSAPPEQAAAIFRTHASHSNAAYLNGVDALGLSASNGDHIDGMSLGGDSIDIQGRTEVFFSVSSSTVGAAGTGFGGGVIGQAALGQQMGDVFESETASRMTVLGTNQLRFNQDVMGLGGNVGPTVSAAGRGNADNLSRLDLNVQSVLGSSDVLRSLDPTIESIGDTRNPDGTLTGGLATRGDVYGSTFDTYFTLDAGSPSLGADQPGDIFVNNGFGVGFSVWAGFADAGLVVGDDIDAIALDRASLTTQQDLLPGLTNVPAITDLISGRYDQNQVGIDILLGGSADTMLFSLAPGSPSLGILDPGLGRTLSAADVFITDFDGTFSLFATAESLGLLFDSDDVDALDSLASPIPEPATLVLAVFAVVFGGAVVKSRRRACA